jgi:hypothetical protein
MKLLKKVDKQLLGHPGQHRQPSESQSQCFDLCHSRPDLPSADAVAYYFALLLLRPESEQFPKRKNLLMESCFAPVRHFSVSLSSFSVSFAHCNSSSKNHAIVQVK